MRTAFKEWASVVKALGDGTQKLILRKGGLEERFRPRAESFLLFPTCEHQNAEDLNPAGKILLEENAAEPISSHIRIEFYAGVSGVFWIPDFETVTKLSRFHVWSEQGVRKKFSWNGDGVHVFLVRIFRLPVPVHVEKRPSYAGCRSWIELETEIETAGSRAVLPDSEYEAFRSQAAALLEPCRRTGAC